jgi:hypothetical protein
LVISIGTISDNKFSNPMVTLEFTNNGGSQDGFSGSRTSRKPESAVSLLTPLKVFLIGEDPLASPFEGSLPIHTQVSGCGLIFIALSMGLVPTIPMGDSNDV